MIHARSAEARDRGRPADPGARGRLRQRGCSRRRLPRRRTRRGRTRACRRSRAPG
jgi:hypothetical protein